MIGQMIIALREGFEAALITAIVLAYLIRVDRRDLMKPVWSGVYLALTLSLFLGALIWFTYGVLPEDARVLFEGAASWLAVIVLTSMIYWMASRGRRLKEEVEKKITEILRREESSVFTRSGASTILTGRRTSLAFAALGFVVVFREGLETVLFLTPFMLSGAVETVFGAAAGLASALTLSYVIFKVGLKLNIRRFFYYTSILLALIAAGLAGYGTHELLEYFESLGLELGWLSQNAYVLNVPSGSILHHKGAVGSIFAVMLGYTTQAEWLRLIVHVVYLAAAITLVLHAYSKRS